VLDIRPINVATDVEATRALYVACGWPDPGPPRSRDEYLLAWQDSALIGSLMFWTYGVDDLFDDAWLSEYGPDAKRLDVCEIAVANAWQGNGVGRALMHAAASRAVSDGLAYLWAIPADGGGPDGVAGRVRFFERCGMADVPALRNCPDGRVIMAGSAVDVLAATRTQA
jgi:GNAT superfamily N-acetyltransferase